MMHSNPGNIELHFEAARLCQSDPEFHSLVTFLMAKRESQAEIFFVPRNLHQVEAYRTLEELGLVRTVSKELRLSNEGRTSAITKNDPFVLG